MDTTELLGPESRFPGLPPGDVKGQKFQTREKSLPRVQHCSLAAAGAPVSVLGFTHSRTPHPDVTPTWAVHKAALRPQASEVHCRQDPTLPRTAHSNSDTALLAAATLTARKGEGVCRRLEGACAPRAGSGALWEARAFAASANMAAP